MQPSRFPSLSLRACAVALLAATASAASAAGTLPAPLEDTAQASLTLSDMQLHVHALPGNTGEARLTFGADAFHYLEIYVIGSQYSTQFGRVTLEDQDRSLNLGNDNSRAGGTLGNELLQGSIYAWGSYQPNDSYYGESKLTARYSPEITPFTEVTLSGRLFAEISGTPDDDGLSYSSAAMGIQFGNQFYQRYIHLHRDVRLLDEEFSLTFRNDTATPRSFDWYTFAVVNAPVPEPSQAMMLALGVSLLGLLGLRWGR